MLERLLIAGSGGQGIILAGKLLATVAVQDIPHVTFFPAYGAEVRGGTSNCHVILSSKEIASPLSEQFESMIIMNQSSADRFMPQTTENCLVVMNNSLCRIPRTSSIVAIHATELADQIGNTRAANMIMLGAFLAEKQVVSPINIEKGIEQILAGKSRALIDLNIKAFRAGLNHRLNS